jgi:hypothetical protein
VSVYIDYILCICSYVSVHLLCFHRIAIVNIASIYNPVGQGVEEANQLQKEKCSILIHFSG